MHIHSVSVHVQFGISANTNSNYAKALHLVKEKDL